MIGLTKHERQARRIATKIVEALAEFERFQEDPQMIWEEVKCIRPKIEVSPEQLAEIRELGNVMEAYFEEAV